ncbi:MAG: Uncharacterised protein [Rhodospirillaceae bacterium]|nr:MAG: Uncharacterised protein [Rhodospirillaceae bacterium]
MVEVLGQLVEAEIFGNARHPPGLGLGLEGAEHHLARVFLVVRALVRHPQHRHLGQALDRLGDDVEVFAGVQRYGHPGHGGEVARPHAPAVHHHVGVDAAGFSVALVSDAGDGAVSLIDAGNFDALDDGRAHLPRTLGQR